MKIAISGKGGVGKTTLAALLSHVYERDGSEVIAVDADPDANLGSALGISEVILSGLVPISRMETLIRERTGAQPGTLGQWFVMNPKVDDIPTRCSLQVGNIRLLVMGEVSKGGAGCACPENTLLRALLGHLMFERDDVVILDMEAGLEHLGRGTARGVDAFVVVVEPGRRSFQTASDVARLAVDLGIGKVFCVGNKAASAEKEDMDKKTREIGLELLGIIPFDSSIRAAEADGRPAWEASPQVVLAAEAIKRRLAVLSL